MCASLLSQSDVDGMLRPRCIGCGFILYANPASASCAVVVSGSEICLVKRKIEPYRGHWTFPAGYQEYDETPEATAIRETREECGLQVEVIRLLAVMYTTDDVRKRANLNVYLCRPHGGALAAGDDAETARFFHINEVPADIGFENNRRIVTALHELARRGRPLDEAIGDSTR